MHTVTQKEIFGIVKAMVGPNDIKAINMTLVDFTGDWPPAILLSQLLYWTDKSRMQGGWIAKTYEEWFSEIRLSDYQVRRATKLMAKMGIVETKFKKFNGTPTLHYRVKGQEFSTLFMEFLKGQGFSFSRVDHEESEGTKEGEETTGSITYQNTTENTHITPVPFELFWDAYAKKEDKKKCEAKWQKLKATQQHQIMAHVPGYVASTPEVRFRKNPLTYLNGECWEDEGVAPAPVVKKSISIADYIAMW